MTIVQQSFEIMDNVDRETLLKKIEFAGRICYKSEDKITENSASNFIKKIVESGHLSIIEHVNITVKFITSRGVTHELVRHRIASYSQESTRYVNYGKKEMTFIFPHYISFIAVNAIEEYEELFRKGLKPYTQELFWFAG